MTAVKEIPRHNVINNEYTTVLSWITVMCHGVRFQISTSLHNLEHTPFEEEYLALVEKFENGDDDPEDGTKLLDWLLRPCYTRFRELIPEKPASITLQAFYYPPTYFLAAISFLVNISLSSLHGGALSKMTD